ncbi:ribosome biogenesis GTPase Der [Candidatus Peregrinibacteria bacterium]|nr:ribosome biogenesis GTPase Der [Candidatus Peregrinibacteria bacterium]
MPAVVAIIGRPNVGKSTLFNRILGERIAIESPVSGTTRDPVTALYRGKKVDMFFIDTGGLEFGREKRKEKKEKRSENHGGGSIEEDVQLQARMAIAEADLIIFCVDTKAPVTPGDEEVVRLLRKKSGDKPVLLVGTKYEGKTQQTDEMDLLSFGIGETDPFLISAIHNSGIDELLDASEKILKKNGFRKDPKKDDEIISIAVIGRPNVGKSSLVNKLTNTQKLIVSDIAGTTRDSVDIEMVHEGTTFRLIDTAGLRRRAKVEEYIEKYSVMRALASLQRSDVTLLLLDAEEGVTHQDKYIIEQVLEARTGLVLVVNKWDLRDSGEEAQKIFLHHLKGELSFLPWAPAIFTSALTGKNVQKIFMISQEIFAERKKRIPTPEFNAFLQEVQHIHAMAGMRNTHPRIKYGAQIGISPPHFIFKGSRLDDIHFSSRRYLENRIRDTFGFIGTPVQIEMTTQENPYASTKHKVQSTKHK